MAQDSGPLERAKKGNLRNKQKKKVNTGIYLPFLLSLSSCKVWELWARFGNCRGKRKRKGLITIFYYSVILKSHNSTAKLTLK